jgi:hypothetical protein
MLCIGGMGLCLWLMHMQSCDWEQFKPETWGRLARTVCPCSAYGTWVVSNAGSFPRKGSRICLTRPTSKQGDNRPSLRVPGFPVSYVSVGLEVRMRRVLRRGLFFLILFGVFDFLIRH